MIYPVPRIHPAGDAAALVEVGDEISEEAHHRVRGLDVALASARSSARMGGGTSGIVETIPAYASLLVQYDPAVLTFGELASELLELSETARAVPRPDARLHEIPVAYGGEYGPDLDDVAAAHRLAPEHIIALHSDAIYTVYMLGFAPGFAYMGTVPEAIATPRLETPRVEVPAGSVGIAGQQTGIYPQASPGGWRILGRTGVSLFSPHREPPALLQAGDRVRFVPTSAGAAGVQRDARPQPSLPPVSGGTVEVLSPGALATIQDLGRPGYQHAGVPVSGAMDPFALRAGNLLVGNQPSDACVEVTLAGAAFRFWEDAVIALTGADLGCVAHTPDLPHWDIPLWTSCYLRPGSWIEFRRPVWGCRAYLSIAGGIAVTPVMGSRATYLRGGFGGYAGRALRAGDLLPVGPARGDAYMLIGHEPEKPLLLPPYAANPTVRVVLGPHADRFADDSVSALLTESYAMSPQSDRMGLRLRGPALKRRVGGEMLSAGTMLGAIQIPPDGQPIVLMADRQTAGGYPVIATVVQDDIPLLAQCVPGEATVRFRAVPATRTPDRR